jgi:hypothetical protein
MVLSRYSSTLSHTNLIRTVQEVKSTFDFAREYSISTHQDIGVSINIKNSQLTRLDVVKMNDLEAEPLETLELSPPIGVESSPEVSHVIFRSNSPLRFLVEGTIVNSSVNYVLQFSSQTRTTSDVVVFHYSNSVQVFRKGN